MWHYAFYRNTPTHRQPRTDHRPTDHRPTDHRPTEHRPTEHRPTDHIRTDTGAADFKTASILILVTVTFCVCY